MTAFALNVASIAPTAQPGAAVNTAGAGPLAGFEALLATLFPQANPIAAAPGAGQMATATLPGAPVKADAVKTDGLIAAKDADDKDATAAAETPTVGAPTIGDAAATLAASLMAAQPATVDVQVTTAKDPNATVTAAGQNKGKGLAGFAPAAPQPAAAATAEVAPDITAPAGEAINADAKAPVTTAAKPATAPTQTAPLTQAHQSAAPAPTPVSVPAPTPQVQPQAAAAVAPDAPVETAQADTAVLAAGLVPTAEAAPTPAPTIRAAKADRAKGPADAKAGVSDDMKPVEAADKPAHGKSVQAAQAAAKDASTVEAAETRPEEAQVDADSPEPMMQAEARLTTQASTPTAAPIHGVRGGPETVANLAAQIVKKADGKTSRFDVELNPLGLGKVDVRIEIGAHGRITAGMTFDNPQAAADVKARANELQRALEQAGFDISGGISFDVAGERGQQQQNQAWQDQSDTSRAFQGRAFRAALDTAGDAAEAANQGALRLRRGVSAGVDVRI